MEAESLYDELLALADAQRYPPVHTWHPEHSGTIDIRIDSNGEWHHEGRVMVRKALVRLFSTGLRRDEDCYHLVAPGEKLRIEVDDVPFVAIDAESRGKGADVELLFTTNVGDYVVADEQHQVWVQDPERSPRPYLHVRDGLNALISRPLYYRLVEQCVINADGCWLTSRGTRFRLG